MPLISRWGLMYSVRPENIAEHSFQVAFITNHLVSIKNKAFGGNLDANLAVTYALYHEVSETKLLDTPTPVKYSDPEFTDAIKKLEHKTEVVCVETLPEQLQESFRGLVVQKEADPEYKKIVKAADVIAAYIKTLTELKFHNVEFVHVKENLEETLEPMVQTMPEVKEFLNIFVAPSVASLDLANMGINPGGQKKDNALDPTLKTVIVERMLNNQPALKEFLNIFVAPSVDKLDLSNMDVGQNNTPGTSLNENHKIAAKHMVDTVPEIKEFLESFLDDISELQLGKTNVATHKGSLEHSHKVAVIAHVLGVLNKVECGGDIDPEKAAGYALQYEMTKSMNLTEENPDKTAILLALKQACSANMLEGLVDSQEIDNIPDYLQDSLLETYSSTGSEQKYQDLVEAADTIAQYIESLTKIRFNFTDYLGVKESLENKLMPLMEKMPEVDIFIRSFVPDCTATIDQITKKASSPTQAKEEEEEARLR